MTYNPEIETGDLFVRIDGEFYQITTVFARRFKLRHAPKGFRLFGCRADCRALLIEFEVDRGGQLDDLAF